MRGESARPGKRPLRALSASEKMEAIQRVHEGESKASVARDIGVPESTLRGWCKSEHKIRGMARNSSTPDSEAHSPASSSGTNLAMASMIGANHSSEDEGPSAKRVKMETSINTPSSSYCANENSENEASRLSDASKLDYVSLMAQMAGMRPENSTLLLQQLGLLTNATSGMAKSLLNLPTMMPHTSTVGLVENGLQYTKSNGNNRHSLSAIAPAQMNSAAKAGTRKSLPPAAEAPLTPVPASPRQTNDMMTAGQHRDNTRRTSSQFPPTINNKKVDDALLLWLAQQQHLHGPQSTNFNPSNNQQDGSWFWQWYKQCNYPQLVQPTPTPIAKKSTSRARALLDNVLCNNNNENVKRSMNTFDVINDGHHSTDAPVISTEEAIEHGEKFFKWLDKCSEPSVTRLQIMQFKYLLDNLKACRKKSANLKQSRK